MGRIYIIDLKAGQAVETALLLKHKELQRTKTNKPYLKISLADKSGSIEGRMWDNAERADSVVDIGMVVSVKGSIELWKDLAQIKVDEIRPAEVGTYAASDLIRAVENVDEILASVKNHLDGIANAHIKSLIGQFLDDKDFIKRFKTSPGARSWHNAYIGGLLEHTLEVMTIVHKACELYPSADRDVCMAGALLHDIGKIYELDPVTFEYTVEGGLIGHLPIGFEMLSRKIDSISAFPPSLATHLKHVILSHHGEYEQQSPVLPKTLEATIVYQADELVSQANAVQELIRAQSASGKDWTNFVAIKNRKYFLKGKQAI